MYLKRIDVVGFKSFADKTGIDFSPGITAVVGPNGSGKSNIADAIRWVLGEQSAKNLRGTRMEDVIFAGSETRRPINFCEVTLTLDNSDRHLAVVFDEVTVTRRVYRSGESEYLINRQPCRLRDITELFMDSGMGRESYSIIGQGRIEEMLSTRPEDRRGPFEDAAGIVKFKFRKREAERKLEETAANILRVDDILAELNRQAGPLEAEAERARRYQALESQWKALDIALCVAEIDQLNRRWREASATVADISRLRAAQAEAVANREQGYEQVRRRFEQVAAAADAMQKRLMEDLQARERSEGDVALARERLQHAREAIADRRAQLQQLGAEREALGRQLAQVDARRHEVRAEREVQSAALEVALSAVDPASRQRLEEEIARLNADLIDAHQQAAHLRNERRMAEESIAQEDRRRDRLEQDVNRFTEEVARLAAEEERYLQASEAHLEEIRIAQANMEALGERAQTLGQEDAALAGRINELRARAASLSSRYELLRELEEGYDGYALGVKTVLQAAGKQRLGGVHGALATLIEVSKEHETAVEIALGGALQNIVVETEADARAAIDLLKRRQAGRATFLPISVIKPRRLSAQELERVRTSPGFIGVASDLVRCRPEHRGVIEHLLGNVVVAERLVDANELARRLDYRVRIVTREGDVVAPGGAMTGGSHQRRGPGLLGRSRERRELERQLEACRAEEEEIVREQAALRQRLAAVGREQQALWTRLEELRTARSAAEAAALEARGRLEAARERLEALRWDAQQLLQGQDAWRARAAEAEARLTEAGARIQTLERALELARDRLASWDAETAARQEQVTQLRVHVARLEQEEKALADQAKDLRDRLERLEARQRVLEQDIGGQETSARQAEQAIAEASERLAALSERVVSLEADLERARQSRAELEADASAAERDLRAARLALSELDERLHRAEVQAERADLELNHALKRLADTYQMTYEWARGHHPPPEDAEAARREADRLRRAMAELGTVNAGAIEEWERLRERLAFLTQERDDLERARADLNRVIDEMDEEMSRRFLQTFEQIRAEFQVSFRQLFDGGRADLTLTAPDQPLTTGIEVIAQPPGKKLQNLNLLSGGERALTAMALLFAILKVRPVPFCVLDEVEAALDEANVGRFAQQLRRFSDETQFIVITHRRGTMEEADVLYGVTMQESGVSSLIGVRLGDDEPEFETA
ncbi:chromosome segregation protein SMC [Alicyclobacillus sp.]|uniref:chromosome segregation protein SMC n=1 Tax=Alicyclobacillus sp. TaxID=61169 RepID=UPI0025BC54C5|nr:chromosome segregation protein SMC [Alicyclobacillus sp.]MCL6516450.1 chromosome segregation protein SMC [Alicyclobacillus sp.]